ncbi:MAG: PEGA domain-containing protein, partial [Candidatus Eisenbacteria bacterium]|nr:PEGA domain-containing protein [Candidatus Eisenbacteria bacterium]
MRGSILWARNAAIAALIGVLAHAAPCRAQTESPTMEDPGVPILTVKSDPPGAIIRLSGDYEFVGRAPWTLHRPLSGLYRVQAFAPGYSPWEGQVYLDPSAPQDLSVRLSRKSRFGAAARSLVIPGWG